LARVIGSAYPKWGGLWRETAVGGRTFYKYHLVNAKLVYCITTIEALAKFFLTGIGKSDLSMDTISYTKARIRVLDPGTNVTEQDSTVITMNDSLTIVVMFR
jgi:hypothetical protein